MEGRGEAKKTKGKVTQYMEHWRSTQVEGGGSRFQQSMFVRHAHLIGRKQEDYSIWKEKDPRSLHVACVQVAPPGIPPQDPRGVGNAHFPRQRSNSP